LGRTGIIRFKGSTPLGQSAGVDEAVHYIDSIIRPNELTRKYPELFKDAGDGTLRFKKDVDFAHVQAKNDSSLAALWKKTRRYDGRGCMDAVEHIEKILAKAFTGKKLAQLGTVLETDRELLKLEYEEAVKAGVISANASADDKVAIMQRKGVLGMNAILSMSLALGRAIAARDGKELWQLIREIAAETMARFIAANSKDGGKKDTASLLALGFDELKNEFRKTAQAAINQQKKIYELLREQLKVYPT
jgi:enolase